MTRLTIEINNKWPYPYIVFRWSEQFHWTAERSFKTRAEAEEYIREHE